MDPAPDPGSPDQPGWPALSRQQYTRERLLEALRRGGGRATRAELAALSGLSRATVSGGVDRLVADGLVRELPPEPARTGAAGAGRPAATLALTPPPGVVVGLDFGHSHLRAALADRSGQVLAERHRTLRVDNSPDDALATATEEFEQLLRETNRRQADVTGVVMGLPSPIDRDTGRVVTNNILPGWVDRAPARELRDRLRHPVVLDNDANLAALGELTYGAGKGVRNLIYLKASIGIGTGLIFDRRLYRGDTGTAGELGHVQIRPDGAVCRCGNRGCLETLVSVPHVLAMLQPMHPEPLTIEHVIDLVKRGDPGARRVVTDAGRTIGRSLADLCNVLNPGALIIGGELAAAGTALTGGIREAVDRYAQPVTANAVTVTISALGPHAEVLGAIALAIQTEAQLAPP